MCIFSPVSEQLNQVEVLQSTGLPCLLLVPNRIVKLHIWFNNYGIVKWEDAYWWILPSGGVRTRKVCYQQGYTIWFLDAQTSQERAVIKTSHVSRDFPELPVLSYLQDFPNIPKFLILLKKKSNVINLKQKLQKKI